MHGLVSQLFWLQVEAYFTLKYRWVPSNNNADAGALTLWESTEHVGLINAVFDSLWPELGGFDMDLMATTASLQRPPIFAGGWEEPLSFCSRHHTAGSSCVDVLTQRFGRMPPSTVQCFSFCFLPPQMTEEVTAFLVLSAFCRNPGSSSFLVLVCSFGVGLNTPAYYHKGVRCILPSTPPELGGSIHISSLGNEGGRGRLSL